MRRIKTLVFGTIVCVGTALFFGFISNWGMAIKVTGGVGAISWLLAGIFSGAFISGDRTRANNSIETTEDKKFRNKYSLIFFVFGLPFLITGLIIYLISK